MTDKNLIIAFNNGNKAAFTSVYERLHPGVYYFAQRFVSVEDAADIVADIFFLLFESQKKFESIEKIRSWLIVAVRNDCLNKLSKEKYKSEVSKKIVYLLSNESIDWLDEHERREIRSAYLNLIYKAVDYLPDEKKTIFNLAFIEGLKNPEIAARLHLDERKIRNTKNRILTLLKDLLKEKAVIFIALLLSLLH